MKKLLMLLCTVFLLTLSSCMSFKASDLSVLRQDNSMKLLGHFEKTVVVHEFLGASGGVNLFDITADVMEDKITEIVWNEINKKGGNGAINVDIEYFVTFGDMLGNGITEGIWAPAHLKVSGDVILYGSGVMGSLDTEDSINVAMDIF